MYFTYCTKCTNIKIWHYWEKWNKNDLFTRKGIQAMVSERVKNKFLDHVLTM
jgi:hypothetical protein